MQFVTLKISRTKLSKIEPWVLFKVKLDTLENRKESMKREPVVFTKEEISDRQIEIKDLEDSEEQKEAHRLEAVHDKKLNDEKLIYEVAISTVGEAVVKSAPSSWRLSLGEDINFANIVKKTISELNSNPPGPMEVCECMCCCCCCLCILACTFT
jgi:hypothetical protein